MGMSRFDGFVLWKSAHRHWEVAVKQSQNTNADSLSRKFTYGLKAIAADVLGGFQQPTVARAYAFAA